MSSEKMWSPLQIFSKPGETDKNIALILLNSTLEMNSVLKTLWKKACIKVAADGGVSRLYTITSAQRDQFVPDVIAGDLDSVTKEHLEFYKNKPDCNVMEVSDQDTTDFTKCLKIVLEMIKSENLPVEEIYVLGGYDGRLDHLLANLCTMQMAVKLTQLPLYLMDSKQTSCVVGKGKHRVKVNTGLEASWCGLIPLGCSSRVTTTGLQWNLSGQEMKFGDLISTSNNYDGKSAEVTIETSEPVLWTMGVKAASQ